MDYCYLVNCCGDLIKYTLYGKTQLESEREIDVSLPFAVVVFILTAGYLVMVVWWMGPIQFLINVLKLREIRFRCKRCGGDCDD